MISIDTNELGGLAVEAGQEILKIYQKDFTVTEKKDRSPLTQADIASHEIISSGLKRKYPDIPVLSEEGKNILHDERRGWEMFWLVDPLDGTKEFIKKNGEFTVNIALITGGRPVIGVVYAPAMDRLYIGDTAEGCRRISGGRSDLLKINSRRNAGPMRIIQSRSHPSDELQMLLSHVPEYQAVHSGSSLKFCVIAEGGADFYPRLGPTWEWDTAAGQAVLHSAGGIVTDTNGEPLLYNKADLLNPYFYAASHIEIINDIKDF